MNILVVCQYYFPEPFRIADICEELVRRSGNRAFVRADSRRGENSMRVRIQLIEGDLTRIP